MFYFRDSNVSFHVAVLSLAVVSKNNPENMSLYQCQPYGITVATVGQTSSKQI